MPKIKGSKLMEKNGICKYFPPGALRSAREEGWKYGGEMAKKKAKQVHSVPYGSKLTRKKLRETAEEDVRNILDPEPEPEDGKLMVLYSCKMCKLTSLNPDVIASHIVKEHEAEMKQAVQNWMKDNMSAEEGKFFPVVKND